MRTGIIILIVIIIIVIIALLGTGIGLGIFFGVTGEPTKKEKCEDGKKYKYNNEGKERCCDYEPTEWSRWQRSYTKCPTPPEPKRGNCDSGKYQYGSDKKCCDNKPTNYDFVGKYYKDCSTPTPTPSTPTPIVNPPKPIQGRCPETKYEYGADKKCCNIQPYDYDNVNKYFKYCNSVYEPKSLETCKNIFIPKLDIVYNSNGTKRLSEVLSQEDADNCSPYFEQLVKEYLKPKCENNTTQTNVVCEDYCNRYPCISK